MTGCPADVADALARQGLRPRRIVEISPVRRGKRGRRAYRVELEDGTSVKVRCLESPNAAQELVALRAGLEARFAPVIGRHGCVLVEMWIEGVVLTAAEAECHLEEAGSLLGRLHATKLDDGPRTIETAEWRELASDEDRAAAGRIA